jgi:hypothetical protein
VESTDCGRRYEEKNVNQCLTRVFTIGCLSLCASTTIAQDTRYFDEDGIMWRETVRRMQVPETTTHSEKRTQTVYRQEFTTEMRKSNRTVYTPSTQYFWRPRYRGVLNPFVPTTVSYELVPAIQWQAHTEVSERPVVTSQVVPEQRTVEVLVRTTRYVQRDEVSRVALGAARHLAARVVRNDSPVRQPVATPSQPRATISRQPVVGGVSRLESDPPRRSSSVPAPTIWR